MVRLLGLFDYLDVVLYGKSREPHSACVYWVLWHKLRKHMRNALLSNVSVLGRAAAKNPQPSYFDGLSESNPYKGLDPTAQLSGWNRFTDWLGITNNAGQATYEARLNAQNYESQLMLSQDQYQMQADAMRKAGYNPDFNDAGAMNTPSGEVSNQAGANAAGSFARFGQAMGSIIQSALGIASGITQIQGTRIASDLSALGQTLPNVVSSAVDNTAVQFLGTGQASKGVDTRSRLVDALKLGRVEVDPSFLTKMSVRALPRPRTRRARRALDNYLMSYFGSADFQRRVFDSISKTNSAAMGAVESFASNLGKNADDDIVDVLVDISSSLLKAEQLESHGRRDYANTFDYGLSAEVANISNTEQREANQFRTNLNSTIREIVDKLRKDADDPNKDGFARVFASSMLVLMSTQFMSSRGGSILPSFSK